MTTRDFSSRKLEILPPSGSPPGLNWISKYFPCKKGRMSVAEGGRSKGPAVRAEWLKEGNPWLESKKAPLPFWGLKWGGGSQWMPGSPLISPPILHPRGGAERKRAEETMAPTHLVLLWQRTTRPDSQIGWSCCCEPSWHSQRPPAEGWTAE